MCNYKMNVDTCEVTDCLAKRNKSEWLKRCLPVEWLSDVTFEPLEGISESQNSLLLSGTRRGLVWQLLSPFGLSGINLNKNNFIL